MRVLMTGDAVGGVWTFSLGLAEALGRAGDEVVLMTMGPRPSPTQRAQAEAVPGLHLVETDFRLEWMPGGVADQPEAARACAGLAAAIRADVVHLGGYALALQRYPAPVTLTAHSCVFSWFEAVRGAPPPPEWAGYADAVGAGLAAADTVVAPSGAMLAALARHYRFAPSRGTVIANGIAPRRLPGVRRERRVLAAGRFWDEGKNLSVVESVAARLAVPLRIAGDGEGPGRRAAPPRHATMLGRLGPDALHDEMSRAAIFFSPALYEPFGLAALEAARAGCALVLGDLPSQREIWGEAAVFVDPQDAEAAASRIERLITDVAGRRALASRSLARAASLSAEAMAARYRALWGGLLTRTAAA